LAPRVYNPHDSTHRTWYVHRHPQRRIVNEGRTIEGDLAIRNGRIEAIGVVGSFTATREIDANGAWLLPA